MTTIGGIVALLIGPFLYIISTRLGYLLEDLWGLNALLMDLMLPTSILMIVGGGISFIGSRVARSNPRAGGIVAIVGSIAGGLNIITLLGGVFLIQSNQSMAPPPPQREIPPTEEARWRAPGIKRCPICNAQMPMDAKFCPNCGEPFGGV